MRLLVVLLFLVSAAHAQTSATYTVTFEATWSEATHPTDFPAGAHFSPLVGLSHGPDVALWAPGEIASDGIEQMAERGRTDLLAARITALGRTPILGSTFDSPGTHTVTVTVDDAHPLVTLVSMLAPSPDWFVGVAGLSLRDGNGWAEMVEVPLDTWDAGTDSGPSYTSPDADTQPRIPVAHLDGYPLVHMGSVAPVGRFVFTRQSVGVEDTPDSSGLSLVGSNPARAGSRFRVGTSSGKPVRADLFDVRGRWLHVLADAAQDGHTVEIPSVPPGLYVVRLTAGSQTATRRLVVVR